MIGTLYRKKPKSGKSAAPASEAPKVSRKEEDLPRGGSVPVVAAPHRAAPIDSENLFGSRSVVAKAAEESATRKRKPGSKVPNEYFLIAFNSSFFLAA